MGVTDTSTPLFKYTPAQWRAIHYLRGERVVSKANPATGGSKVSTDQHDARRLVDRQGVSFDHLLDLERDGYIDGWIGLGYDHPIYLRDLRELPKTANKYAQVKVSLSRKGQALARDPMHLVLQAAGRNRQYRVADVAGSAGVNSADVRQILRTLESADLAGLRNDQGYVPVAMWTGDIPSHLRVALTRKGGTYLARKN